LYLVLLWRIRILFFQSLPLGLFLLSTKQIKLFARLLLDTRLLLSLRLENALKVVGFVVVKCNVELVACSLFERFLLGVLSVNLTC
jgi:hypothetical protein